MLLEGIDNGEVQPLPYATFSKIQTEEAFSTMTQGDVLYMQFAGRLFQCMSLSAKRPSASTIHDVLCQIWMFDETA